MKVLYITTIGGTMILFKDIVKQLIDDGVTVDIACNNVELVPACYVEWGCKVYEISCSRDPFVFGNVKAIKEIFLILGNNHYDIVHCHTPIAAACTRLACRSYRKRGLSVIYTAHGFHFYKGAPKKNWILYYPVEKICSLWTDVLITINQEDYALAQKQLFAKNVYYVPGVGIDLTKFDVKQRVNCHKKIREEFSIPIDSLLLVSVGELNKNKNHSTIIRALGIINDPSIHYIIAGRGALLEQLKLLSKELGIDSQIHFAGFRDDIPYLYAAADICVFPSIREGQGLAAIEGMASGLPLIASNNRGTRGFLVNNENALICNFNDINAFAEAIVRLKDDPQLRKSMGNNNKGRCQEFDVKVINEQLKEIYWREYNN